MTDSTLYSTNPYVGPRPFTIGEQIYGREREIVKLFNLFIAKRIVLLYSPSGAGKTSLIQAGLIPKLEEEEMRILSKGDRSAISLIRVGLEAQREVGSKGEASNRYVLSTLMSLEQGLPVHQQLPPHELAGMDIPTYLDRRANHAGEVRHVVLIFDQFEEILTVGPVERDAKRMFFKQLGQALVNRHRWALFAMREEYLGAIEPYVRFVPTQLRDTVRLDLLGEQAARRAMREPVRRLGVEFSDAATQRLADDLRRERVQRPYNSEIEEQLGPHVEPVQLQVVCYRLWEKWKHVGDKEITEEHIKTLAKVDNALGSYYAEQVAAAAVETGTSERVIREWFDQNLITKENFRNKVLLGTQQSQDLGIKTIQRLIDTYLVRVEQWRGVTWFELIHDRLIEPVRVDNARWREANLSTLQRQVDLWERQRRPKALLLLGDALCTAQRWAIDHAMELTSVEREFLDASELEQRQHDEQRKRAVIALAQALAAQALRQYRRHKSDERVALLARQAYSFHQRSQGPVLDQIDEALRAILGAPHFSTVFHNHTGSVKSIAFSSDGTLLASSSGDTAVCLWDLRQPGAAPTLLPSPAGVIAVKFNSQDEPLAIVEHAGRVQLWKLREPDTAIAVLSADAQATALAFSPDAMLLALATANGAIQIWEWHESAHALTISAEHTARINALAYSDGTLVASGGRDGGVRLWNVRWPEQSPTLLGSHEAGCDVLAFSPDGRTLVSGGRDKVCLWDLHNPVSPPVLLYTRETEWTTAAWSLDSRIVALGCQAGLIRLWEVHSSSAAATVVDNHKGTVKALVFNRDGTLLASGSDGGSMRVRAMHQPSAALLVSSDDEGWVTAVAFSPDGHTLVANNSAKTIRVWDLRQPNMFTDLLGHMQPINSLTFSPDGKLLASGSQDTTARLWNMRRPDQESKILRGHEKAILMIAFSPDGAVLATASDDSTIRLWDVHQPQREPRILQAHTDRVTAIAWNPDGTILASGGDRGSVRVWDLRQSDPTLIVSNDSEDRVTALTFSPDGTLLASGSYDETVLLWDLREPDVAPKILYSHEGRITSLAFSPDGALLASGGDDSTIQVWDTRQPGAPIVLEGHTGTVTAVVFHPDGLTLASGSQDSTIRLWPRTEVLADMVCTKVGRNLSMEEWRQFVGTDVPYERTCPNLPAGDGAPPNAPIAFP